MVSSCLVGQWNLSHSCDDFRYEVPGCLAEGKALQVTGTKPSLPSTSAPLTATLLSRDLAELNHSCQLSGLYLHC